MKQIDTLITIISKIYFLLRSFNQEKCSCTLLEHHHLDRRKECGQLTILFPNPSHHLEWMDDVILPKDAELVNMEEALDIMKISRATLTRLRNNGKINTIVYRRSVRFLRSEIEEARIWYSIPKGKV